MSNLVRTKLEDIVTPLLTPVNGKKWKVIPYNRNLDVRLANPTAMFNQQSIDPLVINGQVYKNKLEVTVVVSVLTPITTPEDGKVDDSLDTFVLAFVEALAAQSDLTWDGATKFVLESGIYGYDITIRLLAN